MAELVIYLRDGGEMEVDGDLGKAVGMLIAVKAPEEERDAELELLGLDQQELDAFSRGYLLLETGLVKLACVQAVGVLSADEASDRDEDDGPDDDDEDDNEGEPEHAPSVLSMLGR